MHNGSCLWPAHKNFLKYTVPTDWPLCKKTCHGKVSSTPLWEPSCRCLEGRLLQDQRCGGTSPAVLWLRLCLPMQGAQVRSLVGELRPHMTWVWSKIKKEKISNVGMSKNSDQGKVVRNDREKLWFTLPRHPKLAFCPSLSHWACVSGASSVGLALWEPWVT